MDMIEYYRSFRFFASLSSLNDKSNASWIKLKQVALSTRSCVLSNPIRFSLKANDPN